MQYISISILYKINRHAIRLKSKEHKYYLTLTYAFLRLVALACDFILDSGTIMM